ncbi:hypothetical protein CPB83DRAFT_781213 [Crepidotus variabilis]|uniref:Uncharacterized protein n=1 Tax=Crepidotus variabilis TaxID=179855 RepID=A0A9P6ETR4_9AGAR|nr:hypothetical protein CPB83DRAFT_781213 [Crepidotus variabilis]
MSSTNEWSSLLRDHPIFSLPKSFDGPQSNSKRDLLELSTNTLTKFTHVDPKEDAPTPSGRRQVMILKDADLIVAAGKEVRISSVGDLKLSQSIRKSYKTLHTPSLQFEIHQLTLNPTGKLLAIAGAFQVAVIVLPRPGYSRLVPDLIDCKSVQVGQFYHAASNSAPIAKIEWHPWGEAGSTLLVMTVDGKLREYDISVDTEEPQQNLAFVQERKSGSYMAEDDSEREVASFTLGKGRGDWGPLTVYAVMKSGDIYSYCPYLPRNASVPSSYIHSLECFISAKQDKLAMDGDSSSRNASTLYDYQRKYINALVKQLPPGTVFPSASKPCIVHPPPSIRARLLRQGPFLLQPAPLTLEGSEGGDATDVAYLAFGTDDDDAEEDGHDTEHLGVVMVSYQDGKIDLFLDVAKVEAGWDSKQIASPDAPMLAVFESIDLGLIQQLKQVSTTQQTSNSVLDLLSANHPIFFLDPLHDDMVYVYHAFGVHGLDISPVLRGLSAALKDGDDEEKLIQKLEDPATTNVRPILNTFSVQRGTSNPVIAVTIPNDVYLTYSIFILTSVMRITAFPLNIRSGAELQRKALPAPSSPAPSALDRPEKSRYLTPLPSPSIYISLLGTQSYQPPTLSSIPQQSLPTPSSGSKEFMLTPDTMRYLGKTVAQVSNKVGDISLAYSGASSRLMLQKSELSRIIGKCREMEMLVDNLRNHGRTSTEERMTRIQDEQKRLLGRLDRLLQALMEKASPELSEHETKWFEELKRMKREILGSGRYDEDALGTRVKTLDKEYARILPSLQSLDGKEKQRGKKHLSESQSLGFSQAFEYGERSNVDRTRISALQNEIAKLADQLGISVGPPPSFS